jgi:hypothetical protein
MQSISTIGLDIAKAVFQVHGVDAAGQWSYAVSWGATTSWRFSRSWRRRRGPYGLQNLSRFGFPRQAFSSHHDLEQIQDLEILQKAFGNGRRLVGHDT